MNRERDLQEITATQDRIIIGKELPKFVYRPDGENAAEIDIRKEGHTVGNLLTHGLQAQNAEYAGYDHPHSLMDKIIVKVRVDDTTPIQAVHKAADVVISDYKEFDLAFAEALKKTKNKLIPSSVQS
jgi:DNA-directed RNA polymerase subunit L